MTRAEAARLAATAETLDRATVRIQPPDRVDAALRALRRTQRLDEMAAAAREDLGAIVAGMSAEERERFARAATG